MKKVVYKKKQELKKTKKFRQQKKGYDDTIKAMEQEIKYYCY